MNEMELTGLEERISECYKLLNEIEKLRKQKEYSSIVIRLLMFRLILNAIEEVIRNKKLKRKIFNLRIKLIVEEAEKLKAKYKQIKKTKNIRKIERYKEKENIKKDYNLMLKYFKMLKEKKNAYI